MQYNFDNPRYLKGTHWPSGLLPLTQEFSFTTKTRPSVTSSFTHLTKLHNHQLDILIKQIAPVAAGNL